MFRFGGVANRGPSVRALVFCYCGNTPAPRSRDAYPDLPLAELVIKSVSKRGPPQPPQTREQCNVLIEIDDLAGADGYEDALARYVTGQLGNNYQCITGDANNSVHFEYSGM